MKAFFYDLFGLNEWLLLFFHSFRFQELDGIWTIVRFAYSYWVVGVLMLGVVVHYLRHRWTASAPSLRCMGLFLAELIVAFSVVWVAVVLIQNIGEWPRTEDVVYSALLLPASALGDKGLPASAPAIAAMLMCLLWHRVHLPIKWALIAYVLFGCVMSVVLTIHWPIEVLAGLVVGVIGAKFAQWYVLFATRLAQNK